MDEMTPPGPDTWRHVPHVPHLAVLLAARPAPQPPRLLELLVELVDVIILHPLVISSETLLSTAAPNFVGKC